MSAPLDQERDDADVAAEYVLGVLDGATRRSLERRAAKDPAFGAEIDAWAERLGPLAAAVPPAEPPAGLWPRIAADLDRVTRRPAGRSEPRGRRVSALWQWLGIGAMGLAAASLAALILVAGQDLRAPVAADGTLTATLASDTGTPLVTVVIDMNTATATLIPVAGAAEPGRVPELWLLPAGGGAPRSLGLITMERPLRVVLKTGELDAPATALAVSMEPEGGSPTGLPTGPVVASGPLNQI
ncbi:anti-sigma factor [Aurantimonas marianensis]|uniref:Regulator of SigK n=1 Tax=Aurantimonas marianensis TaxID=2920428 RepID=A0A9X2H4E0_9HYPH|nr:anti-sigma factor [Aurantimonas marianensis]MCP3054001.1 anti-sigma factor [Aurantimonas marianensis]